MNKTLARIDTLESLIPFDPKYWWTKNRNLVLQGNREIWKELSDEQFELVDRYIDELAGISRLGAANEGFAQDLTVLTDEQFDEFDKLTDDGMEPDAAYAHCLRTIPLITSEGA
jgi:hypothetical protein